MRCNVGLGSPRDPLGSVRFEAAGVLLRFFTADGWRLSTLRKFPRGAGKRVPAHRDCQDSPGRRDQGRHHRAGQGPVVQAGAASRGPGRRDRARYPATGPERPGALGAAPPRAAGGDDTRTGRAVGGGSGMTTAAQHPADGSLGSSPPDGSAGKPQGGDPRSVHPVLGRPARHRSTRGLRRVATAKAALDLLRASACASRSDHEVSRSGRWLSARR